MKINKIDAARSQLDTAIQLWFQDADPISIHTLVYAAHEVIHVYSKKKGRKETLIFDSIYVRPDAKLLWSQITKGPANFFKHAKNDVDAEIDFEPQTSEYFIGMSIHGLKLCGEPLSVFMAAFYAWLGLTRPDLLNEEGAKMVAHFTDAKVFGSIRAKGKGEFLHRFINVSGSTFAAKEF